MVAKMRYYIVMPMPSGEVNVMCVRRLPPERAGGPFVRMPDQRREDPAYIEMLETQAIILRMYSADLAHRERLALPAPKGVLE